MAPSVIKIRGFQIFTGLPVLFYAGQTKIEKQTNAVANNNLPLRPLFIMS